MAESKPTPTVEEIEAAYKLVQEDKSFRSSEPKNTETKLFLVEAYERLTGKQLLAKTEEGEGQTDG